MTRMPVPVNVRYTGYQSFSDLAPLLDALQTDFGTVGATVQTPELAGRGGAIFVPLDIVFDVARFVGEAAAGAIIGTLVTDGGKRFRDAILDFWNREWQMTSGDLWMPFGIHIGSLWLIYEAPITEGEFHRSIKAAQALAETVPDLESGAFLGIWVWNAASQRWDGPQHP